MKWIGTQTIYDHIRLNKGITIDSVSITTIQDSSESFANNDTSLMTSAAIAEKIEAYGYSTGDITGVTITTDSGGGSAASDTAGSADFSILGSSGVGVTNSGTTITAVAVPAEIDHDSLNNYAANEHFTQANITTVGTIGTGVWQGTAIASAYLDSDTAHLSGTQTFTGTKTFPDIIIDGDKNITPGDGSMIHLDTSTLTDNNTSAESTTAKFVSVALEAPTLAASNESVTTTDAATLYVKAAPAAGTNQTLTRAHAIWVDAGNVRLDGEIYMGTTRAMDSSGLLRVANQSTITGLGTISSGVWQGTAIASGYLDCSGVTNVGTLVDLAVTGSSSLGGPSMALTHQDVDQIALDIDASNTTANILDINAQALTTGAAIYIDCNSLGTHPNGGALHIDVDESSTTGIQNTLAHVNYDRTGDLDASANNRTIGLDISMNDLATGNHATSSSYLTALDINLDHANANALVARQIGIDLTLTDADTGYIGTTPGTVGLLSTVEDGGFDIIMQSSADTGDYCTIATTTHGATTITTVDDDGAAAHLIFDIDGDVRGVPMHYRFMGYGTGDGTNYFLGQPFTDAQAPFEHADSSSSDGLTIPAGGGTNVSELIRSGGHVMVRAGTLKKWTGWGTYNSTNDSGFISLFKWTPADNDDTDITPVLLDTVTITGKGNDKVRTFTETSFTQSSVAAGDIIFTQIKTDTNNKVVYFNSTLEIELGA